ncbi:MAG: AraC family transcriptional regulator [Armatimonadota bacterium]
MERHHRLVTSPVQTHVGSLLLGGLWLFGHGVNSTGRLRSYDGAALVLVTRGEGVYKDGSRKKHTVKQGDAILVFPGNPHWYGPQKGQIWDEVYVAFDGPLFDAWFRTGILSPENPIRHLDSTIDDKASWLLLWIERFVAMKDQKQQLQALVALMTFISEIALGEGMRPSEQNTWLGRAQSLLCYDLRTEVDLNAVAKEMGVSYEAFRKRFLSYAGVSPLRYRNGRKIEAAKQLIRYSPQTSNKEIADALGFSDEFHFSKRFRQIAGITPQAFRRS